MAWTRNAVLIPAFAFLAVGGVLAGTVQDQERRSVWTGVYSTEQAKRAEGIYAQACAACHGPMLDGGEMAPPLVGSTFNANWNGMTLGDLMERTRTAMPQNNPGARGINRRIDDHHFEGAFLIPVVARQDLMLPDHFTRLRPHGDTLGRPMWRRLFQAHHRRKRCQAMTASGLTITIAVRHPVQIRESTTRSHRSVFCEPHSSRSGAPQHVQLVP